MNEARFYTQQPEAQLGDRITGTCVTMCTPKTGRVTEVIGPITHPDCGGYRYRIVDTGEFYSNGRPVEPIVYYSHHSEG